MLGQGAERSPQHCHVPRHRKVGDVRVTGQVRIAGTNRSRRLDVDLCIAAGRAAAGVQARVWRGQGDERSDCASFLWRRQQQRCCQVLPSAGLSSARLASTHPGSQNARLVLQAVEGAWGEHGRGS